MNIPILIAAIMLVSSVAVQAKDDPKVVYVGGGRYTCKGESAACASIDDQNRRREAERQQRYQHNQDRAQDYVDRERRKDEERRYDR